MEKQRDKYLWLARIGYCGIGLLVATLMAWSCINLKIDIYHQVFFWSSETFRFLSAFSGFLLLFFVFDPMALGSKILGASGLQFIGIVSYEWFLFHGPLVNWARGFIAHPNGQLLPYVLQTLIPLAATFIFSALVYRYFSLPILNRVRDHLKKS